MTTRDRWALLGAFAAPLSVMTVYLLWIWPGPKGAPPAADAVPWVVAFLTGLPFILRLSPRPGRWLIVLAWTLGGIALLWIYSVAVLCGVRGVCL